MVVGEITENADLLVIGGGPGGYVAAIRAAQLGRQVTLVEQHALGGICLNVGCIPSKTLISAANEFDQIRHAASRGITVENPSISMEQVQVFKQQVVTRLTNGVKKLLGANEVTVIQGAARFIDKQRIRVVSDYETKKIEFRQAIIATGSRPRLMPGIPMDGQVVMDSTNLLSLKYIPRHLTVIGGGYIGLELGTAFRKLGSAVTIVEATSSLLPGVDPLMVRIVAARLRDLGVTIHVNTTVTSLAVEGFQANLTLDKDNKILQADAVLVTVGRVPNTDDVGLKDAGVEVDKDGLIIVDDRLRTSNPDIAAIGDVTPGPMLAHKASYQGKVAADNLSGRPTYTDAFAIPAVIFTDPEIATVGLTESSAREAGYDPIMGRFSLAANGRALSLDYPVGEAVVVADKNTGLLLGIHVAGADASSLIGEGGLALEMGATLEDLALTIHAHPTLPETLMEAAEVALGRPIHTAPRSHP